MEEKWKKIDWIDGLNSDYEVSNTGRVISTSVLRYLGKYHTYKKINRKHELAQRDTGYGYLVVSFKVDGKRVNQYVHRLVATAFLDNPEDKPQVNHKDRNKHNNNVENLEWVTASENVCHSLPFRKPFENHPKEHPKYGKGITKHGQRYTVVINHNYIGNYKTLSGAKRARDCYMKRVQKSYEERMEQIKQNDY